MQRIFPKRGRLVIYADAGEIRLWKEEAATRKMSVSGWVRMKCRPLSTGRTVDIFKESQCPHHKMKGELCYKCDEQFGVPKA